MQKPAYRAAQTALPGKKKAPVSDGTSSFEASLSPEKGYKGDPEKKTVSKFTASTRPRAGTTKSKPRVTGFNRPTTAKKPGIPSSTVPRR